MRAFSTYFQVVNLAEKIHRIRRRRDYLREPAPRSAASLLDACLELRACAARARRRSSRRCSTV